MLPPSVDGSWFSRWLAWSKVPDCLPDKLRIYLWNSGDDHDHQEIANSNFFLEKVLGGDVQDSKERYKGAPRVGSIQLQESNKPDALTETSACHRNDWFRRQQEDYPGWIECYKQLKASDSRDIRKICLTAFILAL